MRVARTACGYVGHGGGRSDFDEEETAMGVLSAGVVVGMISLMGGTRAACRKYLHKRGKACCNEHEECTID